jgi:GNAT superfamily N-acetyltransferase
MLPVSEAREIRAARAADAAEIARLADLLGYPSDVAGVLARLERIAGSADHWVAVAAASALVLPAEPRPLGGWMHVARRFTLESGEFAELVGLVVDAPSRRGGVGSRLVAEAERWARVQRLGRLTVRSNAARVEPHGFYAALGYTHVKSQHVYSKLLGEGAGAVGAAGLGGAA